MKVRDLLEEPKEPWKFKLCDGRVIALDAMNSKILFDTLKNKRKYCEKFFNGEVISLWGDVAVREGDFYSLVQPVLKCYVRHDSWKGSME